ncbi:MAG: hypothetical protein EPN82_05910 [Bacteroidetes bacterium]|nr:MAG: hypothetical protein EPN82_05910 [Bacteroidota bacterium]
MITNSDIIYFILTDRFYRGTGSQDNPLAPLLPKNPEGWHGGNFDGIIEKIPYLKELGITAIWITPVYLSIGEFFGSYGYHGYWALDFEKIDPHLYNYNSKLRNNGKNYLKNLTDKLHNEGMKLILDMVVNHTGYGYLENQYPNKVFKAENFNINDPNSETQQYLNGLPDLDHDQAYVADYFIQNILSWIKDCNIDAIRMDTAKHIEPAFWYLFKSVIKISYPSITLIGEILKEDVWDIPDLAKYQQLYDIERQFDCPLRKKIVEVFINDAPLNWLAKPRLSDNEVSGVLDKDSCYTNSFRLVTFLDSHDTDKRIFTAILDRVEHWDRLKAQKIIKLVLSFLFTTRGVPEIYYGTEIGMEGRNNPDSRKDFPWSIIGQNHHPKPEFKESSEIYKHTKALIELRKKHPAFSSGYLFTLWIDNFAYVYLRAFGDDIIIVAINNGTEDMPYPLNVPFEVNSNIPPRIITFIKKTTFTDTLDATYSTKTKNGSLPILVPAKTARILINSDL